MKFNIAHALCFLTSTEVAVRSVYIYKHTPLIFMSASSFILSSDGLYFISIQCFILSSLKQMQYTNFILLR